MHLNQDVSQSFLSSWTLRTINFQIHLLYILVPWICTSDHFKTYDWSRTKISGNTDFDNHNTFFVIWKKASVIKDVSFEKPAEHDHGLVDLLRRLPRGLPSLGQLLLLQHHNNGKNVEAGTAGQDMVSFLIPKL